MAKNNWSSVKSKNRLSRDIGRYQSITKVLQGISPDAPRCAKCGCCMVIRFSRYGRYWGCGQFPKCKGTQGT